MDIKFSDMHFTNKPKFFDIKDNVLTIKTEKGTDLWQRTYYHFRNDNAPMLQYALDDRYFSFIVKTDFDATHRYDQCGIVMYLDSDNWIKASIECDNEVFSHIGAVVTNNGFSDWSSSEIPADTKSMWYRLSRREMDIKIEYSPDGITYSQMRICHMFNGGGTIRFGVYACSPEDATFTAKFSKPQVVECQWLSHDGQQPDKDIDY